MQDDFFDIMDYAEPLDDGGLSFLTPAPLESAKPFVTLPLVYPYERGDGLFTEHALSLCEELEHRAVDLLSDYACANFAGWSRAEFETWFRRVWPTARAMAYMSALNTTARALKEGRAPLTLTYN